MNHAEHLRQEAAKGISRRWFMKDCGVKLGAIALCALAPLPVRRCW